MHDVLILQRNNGRFLVFQINIYTIQIILSTHADEIKKLELLIKNYLARKSGLYVLKVVCRLDWWCFKISQWSRNKSDDDDEWQLLSEVTLYSLPPVIEDTIDKCLRPFIMTFWNIEKKKRFEEKIQMFDWLKMISNLNLNKIFNVTGMLNYRCVGFIYF